MEIDKLEIQHWFDVEWYNSSIYKLIVCPICGDKTGKGWASKGYVDLSFGRRLEALECQWCGEEFVVKTVEPKHIGWLK